MVVLVVRSCGCDVVGGRVEQKFGIRPKLTFGKIWGSCMARSCTKVRSVMWQITCFQGLENH